MNFDQLKSYAIHFFTLVKKHKTLFSLVVLFAAIYSSISLVNHFNFRTYALDLGLYTHALYEYAHLGMADNIMVKGVYEPLFGGHFDLYLVFLSPFVYIFGTKTLLIFQILAVLFGGVGVYRFFRFQNPNQSLTPIMATAYFYSFFGVFSALAYDYHSVVVSSCLIPWFFYAMNRQNTRQSIFWFVLMLFSQENFSFFMIFMSLGLAIIHRKNRKMTRLSLILSGSSLLYFLLVLGVIIPHFSIHSQYTGFNYSVLGGTPFEALKTLVSHPIDSFKIMFTNHLDSSLGDWVKGEFHLFLLVSGLYVLVLRPYYFIMLLPLYFQKMFHDNYIIWSFFGQYSIEFVSVLSLGIFSTLSEIKNIKTRKVLMFVVLISSLVVTLRRMDNTIFKDDKSRVRFYKADHFKREIDINRIHENLKMIPEDAAVSAQTIFIPHLCLRSKIYNFPHVIDAEYLVLSNSDKLFSDADQEQIKKIDQILDSNEWQILVIEEIMILKKNN